MTSPGDVRAPAAAARLEARYGRGPDARRRNRIVAVALALLAAAVVVAWAVWTDVGGAATDQIDVTTRSFVVNGDSSVSVTWSVAGSSKRLACTIEADAEDHSAVGVVVVMVPPGGGTGTTTVRTVREAVTGLVSGCRPA